MIPNNKDYLIKELNKEINRMRGKHMELNKEIEKLKNKIKKYEEILGPIDKF